MGLRQSDGPYTLIVPTLPGAAACSARRSSSRDGVVSRSGRWCHPRTRCRRSFPWRCVQFDYVDSYNPAAPMSKCRAQRTRTPAQIARRGQELQHGLLQPFKAMAYEHSAFPLKNTATAFSPNNVNRDFDLLSLWGRRMACSHGLSRHRGFKKPALHVWPRERPSPLPHQCVGGALWGRVRA